MISQPDATMEADTGVQSVFTSAVFPRTHPITPPRTTTMAVIEDEFRAATMRQLRAMIAAEEPTTTTPAEGEILRCARRWE